MFVNGHDLLNCRVHLLLLAASGESFCQQYGLFLGLLDGLNERPHASHCGIKLTLPIEFFGVSHCRKQLLELRVFNGRQMAVGIHRQNQELKKHLLLGG